MNNSQEEIIKILITKGKDLLIRPRERLKFTGNSNADDLLNDLQKFPHAFVLACIVDRQMKAERAWLIPYQISMEIGGFEFNKLLNLDMNKIKGIFIKRSLHRFNDIMAKNFYSGIQKIHTAYNDDASNIWKNEPRSATVVKRFLEFDGDGIKIATMAANILVRELKIPMKDYICIDISPDVHVKRVFRRLGFISGNATDEGLLYCARELNPEYPGIFDLSCWEIGKNWCKPKIPHCNECYLNPYCPKSMGNNK